MLDFTASAVLGVILCVWFVRLKEESSRRWKPHVQDHPAGVEHTPGAAGL